LPDILEKCLSRMERNHIHLCKQVGRTWIRRKKRANIAIFIDAQEARKSGLKFYAAPNDVIMCPGNEIGYIPVQYFKEIKIIHTGEILQGNTTSPSIVKQRLNPMVQEYRPKDITGVTSINTYRAEYYNED